MITNYIVYYLKNSENNLYLIKNIYNKKLIKLYY